MPIFGRQRDKFYHEKHKSTDASTHFSKAQILRLTRTRKVFAILSSFLFFIVLVFLILVQIGNVRNKRVLRGWYMFKIDISRIQFESTSGGLTFTNSLAQTIGLHDFYQVGLWNWCEGYDDDRGVTFCSQPTVGYWFNPVSIILNELLAGASITLPAEVYTYLTIIREASHAMFGCFFAATICSFICLLVCPLTLYSRLATLFIGTFALLTGLATVAGAVISTAMWSIFTHVINSEAPGLGIQPSLGKPMLAFEWIAAGCALIAAVVQVGLMCCCTSRRDVRRGKNGARKEILREREGAWETAVQIEEPANSQIRANVDDVRRHDKR